MTDGSRTSPYSLFYHRYDDGPNPDYDPSRFMIYYTLEKGAEAYYSRVRVVVIKKIGLDDSAAKTEIQARRPVKTSILLPRNLIEIEPPSEDKDSDKAFDDHTSSDNGSPIYLYTLIFELVDLSDATSSFADIRLMSGTKTSTTQPVQIPDNHRLLYDYEKCTTAHSPSCILLLTTSSNPPRIFRYGPPTHGLRISLPSETRPLFTQPPPEIMYNIFSVLAYNHDLYGNWRVGLVAVSLVCRAWWKVAICLIYEDFETQSRGGLHIGRLATTLKGNPWWGRYIKWFSPYCFNSRTATQSGNSTLTILRTASNTRRLSVRDIGAVLAGEFATQFRGSALTILKTASNMRRLSVGDVGAVVAGEFIEAFCKMTGLQKFTQLSPNSPGLNDDGNSKGKTYLNAAQLTKCFAHWPKLRQATVERFGQPHAEDGNEFVSAKCALDQIAFQRGFVSMAQLRAITASSRNTLHIVVLSYIKGISNEELTSWLGDFGPNLTSLTLGCNVFTRFGAEELAVDATINKMSKLSHLETDGPVATVLTLLRFKPIEPGRRHVKIRDPMLIDPHAFVIALRTTMWKSVDVKGLRMEDELVEEIKKVAKGKGINLWM